MRQTGSCQIDRSPKESRQPSWRWTIARLVLGATVRSGDQEPTSTPAVHGQPSPTGCPHPNGLDAPSDRPSGHRPLPRRPPSPARCLTSAGRVGPAPASTCCRSSCRLPANLLGCSTSPTMPYSRYHSATPATSGSPTLGCAGMRYPPSPTCAWRSAESAVPPTASRHRPQARGSRPAAAPPPGQRRPSFLLALVPSSPGSLAHHHPADPCSDSVEI